MRKYLYLVKNKFISSLDYRQELLTSLLNSILIFVGMAIFWRAVYFDHDLIKGYTYEGMIQYYVVLGIMSDLIDSRFCFDLAENIVDGSISNLLMKPIKVKTWLIFAEISKILPLLFIKLLIFLTFYQLFIGKFEFRIENLMQALAIVPIAYLINANLYFILGCFAFWVGQIKGLLYGIRRVFMFLSGGFIPLIFFPEDVQYLLRLLPFKYVFQLPLDIFNNGLDLNKSGNAIIGLVIWTMALSLFSSWFLIYSYKSNESVGI